MKEMSKYKEKSILGNEVKLPIYVLGGELSRSSYHLKKDEENIKGE